MEIARTFAPDCAARCWRCSRRACPLTTCHPRRRARVALVERCAGEAKRVPGLRAPNSLVILVPWWFQNPVRTLGPDTFSRSEPRPQRSRAVRLSPPGNRSPPGTRKGSPPGMGIRFHIREKKIPGSVGELREVGIRSGHFRRAETKYFYGGLGHNFLEEVTHEIRDPLPLAG